MISKKEKEDMDSIFESMKDIGKDLNDLMMKHNSVGTFELIMLLEMGRLSFEKNLNFYKSEENSTEFGIEGIIEIQKFVRDIMDREEAMKKVTPKEYKNEEHN